MSSTKSVLDHHLTNVTEQDLTEIISDYTDQSIIVTNMGIFCGIDEIESLFEDFSSEFSKKGAKVSIKEEIVEGDFAYITWEGESPENIYEFATSTFYIPEDKILFQTSARKISSKDLIE